MFYCREEPTETGGIETTGKDQKLCRVLEGQRPAPADEDSQEKEKRAVHRTWGAVEC